jgi:Cytochrome C oxidase, cbb3-type, subunit III
MADGQIFNTITHGYNTMMAYGDKVTVKDRWAIIAYIRALQKSENARMEDVPEDQRGALDNEGKAENPPPTAVPGQPVKTETTQTR